MIMSLQHTALLLRENANEAESSAISHQKTQSICSKLIIFQNGTSTIRYRREFEMVEIWRISAHELNVTIVKSYFDPNKFREYFIWKHSEKTLIAERKQISSKRMTLSLLWTLKLIFYYTVLCPFYRSRVFMRINLRKLFNWMHLACFSFICIYME